MINPEDWFDPWNVSIHGIDENDVRNSPTLPEVRDELRRGLRGSVLVSHTSFDRVAFERAMTRYDLEQLQVTWLDSAESPVAHGPTATEALAGVSRTLRRILAFHSSITMRWKTPEQPQRSCFTHVRSPRQTSKDGCSELIAPIFPSSSGSAPTARREGNVEGALCGETIVFTGALGIPRQKAADLAANAGCNVVPNVTKKVSILVVGTQGQEKV